MTTVAEIQIAYRAINRTDLEATVAQATADAINSGVTTLDAYIASQIAATVSTTQAAVAISAFVTGKTPTSTHLDELKVAADAQLAYYTAMGVANPALGAYEAFGLGFSEAPEFAAKYGTVGAADFIHAVYTSVYGTTPTVGAFANLSAQITYFTNLYINAGVSAELAALQAKGAVLGQIVGYAFVSNASANATIDNQVVSFLTSAANGDTIGFGAALPASSVGDAPLPDSVVGSTFTLTIGVDTITGTTGNDYIRAVVDGDNAANNTLSSPDSINGGAGTDTFNIIFNVAATTALPAAEIMSVEKFELRNVSGNTLVVDFANISGEQQIWNTASTFDVSVNNIAAGALLGVQGNAGSPVSATNATYVAGATAASILIAGGVGTAVAASGAISATGADLISTTITSQGGANFVGGIRLANTVKTLNVDAQTNLTATFFGAVAADATLNVSGAGKASFGILDASVDVIDASKNSGGVTLTLDSEADTKFTGGAGADVVTLGAIALTTGTVDGGAGSDTLVASSTNLNSAATGAKYTNFEFLRATGGGTIDLDNISGITAIELDGGSVTELSAAQAGSVRLLSGGYRDTYEIGVKGASTVGQVDTVALTIDDGLVTKDTIYLNRPTLTGVENLSINAVDNVDVWSLVNAVSLNSITLSGAGDQTFAAGDVNLAADTVINGSAATGKLTIDASEAQAGSATTGFSITGGSAVDTIDGTLKDDIIIGGAGNDILFGRSGADTIVGGDGNDVIVGDGTYDVADTERAVVTFSNLAAGETLTLAGLTLNNTTGSVIEQQKVAYFFGSGGLTLPAGAAQSGSLTGYTTEHPGYGTNVFSSTTENSNVADLTQTGTGSVTITIYQGVSASTPTLGDDTAGADILTGGAGKDAFEFAAGSSHATVTDTITDLDLGSDVLAGQVDTLVFQNSGATATVVNLTFGEQGTVTSAASLAAAAAAVANVASTDGNTVQFTYGTDTFIYHNVDGNGTFDGAADLLVKVTGMAGTLDASDIVLR